MLVEWNIKMYANVTLPLTLVSKKKKKKIERTIFLHIISMELNCI